MRVKVDPLDFFPGFPPLGGSGREKAKRERERVCLRERGRERSGDGGVCFSLLPKKKKKKKKKKKRKKKCLTDEIIKGRAGAEGGSAPGEHQG